MLFRQFFDYINNSGIKISVFVAFSISFISSNSKNALRQRNPSVPLLWILLYWFCCHSTFYIVFMFIVTKDRFSYKILRTSHGLVQVLLMKLKLKNKNKNMPTLHSLVLMGFCLDFIFYAYSFHHYVWNLCIFYIEKRAPVKLKLEDKDVWQKSIKEVWKYIFTFYHYCLQ